MPREHFLGNITTDFSSIIFPMVRHTICSPHPDHHHPADKIPLCLVFTDVKTEVSFGLPYQKRFSSPGAVSSVSGAGNSGAFPCSGAMSVLDCHHLHKGFTESAPARPCTAPSAKFHPGHTVPQGTASLCILTHLPQQKVLPQQSQGTRGPLSACANVPWDHFTLSLPLQGQLSLFLGESHQWFGVQGFCLLQVWSAH